MYPFIKVYVDSRERFSWLTEQLESLGKSLWGFSWENDRLARTLKWILRLSAIGLGLLLGILYWDYATSQGLGGFGTLFAVVLIVGYSGVALWGWIVPAHWALRGGLGVASFTTLLLLAVSLCLPFLVLSTGYLLVVVVLTLSSVFVFVPLRIWQEWSLRRSGITYLCPYDNCSYAGLPMHRCGCGELHDRLVPSWYGIFHHTCRHCLGDSTRLPTLNALGRNELRRFCAECERELIHPSLGNVPVWPIAVVGAGNTGKSIYLRQVVRGLAAHYQHQPGTTFRIDSANQERHYQRGWRILDGGKVLAKTIDSREALGLAVDLPPPTRMEGLAYLYDTPGERVQDRGQFERMHHMEHVRGILLLVDPFSLPALVEQGKTKLEISASKILFSQVLDVLVDRLQLTSPTDVPLAVVLSKGDVLPTDVHPCLKGLYPPASPSTDSSHNAIRDALRALGAKNELLRLRLFANHRFFVCSALGRTPSKTKTTPFKPVGILEPMLWLFEQMSLQATDISGK